MRTPLVKPWLALAILGAFLLGVNAGDNRNHRLTEAASAALERMFPGRPIAEVDNREKDHEDILIVRLQEGPEKRRTIIEITPAGQVLEVDEDIAVEDLPEAVRRALHKAFPEARIERAEMETMMRVTYRVDLDDRHRERRVKLSRRGRIYEIEKRD